MSDQTEAEARSNGSGQSSLSRFLLHEFISSVTAVSVALLAFFQLYKYDQNLAEMAVSSYVDAISNKDHAGYQGHSCAIVEVNGKELEGYDWHSEMCRFLIESESPERDCSENSRKDDKNSADKEKRFEFMRNIKSAAYENAVEKMISAREGIIFDANKCLVDRQVGDLFDLANIVKNDRDRESFPAMVRFFNKYSYSGEFKKRVDECNRDFMF